MGCVTHPTSTGCHGDRLNIYWACTLACSGQWTSMSAFYPSQAGLVAIRRHRIDGILGWPKHGFWTRNLESGHTTAGASSDCAITRPETLHTQQTVTLGHLLGYFDNDRRVGLSETLQRIAKKFGNIAPDCLQKRKTYWLVALHIHIGPVLCEWVQSLLRFCLTLVVCMPCDVLNL